MSSVPFSCRSPNLQFNHSARNISKIRPSSRSYHKSLARRKVIAWDQPDTSVSAVDFSLPPSIVLMTEDRKIITLAKAQLLGNGCLIHVQCACCKKVMLVSSTLRYWLIKDL